MRPSIANAGAAVTALLSLASGLLAQEPIVIDAGVLPSLSAAQDLPSDGRYTIDSALLQTWSLEHRHTAPTEFVRFRIRAIALARTPDWHVAVLDEAGNEVDRITPGRFTGQVPNATAWTDAVPGVYAMLKFRTTAQPFAGVELRIDRYRFQSRGAAPKVILDPKDPDLVDLIRSHGRGSSFHVFSRPIAYIFLFKLEQEKDTNCTGFLVAGTLLVTNHHCISQPSHFATAHVRFHYESDAAGPAEKLKIVGICAKDQMLDYSLLRLERAPAGLTAVPFDLRPLAGDRPMVLIQHPDGRAKNIALRKCKVRAPSVVGLQKGFESDFSHACDSEGGSSGSPLMDSATGAVLGLHHMARENVKSKAYDNYGVKIRLVLEHIRSNNLPAYREIDPSGALLARR